MPIFDFLFPACIWFLSMSWFPALLWLLILGGVWACCVKDEEEMPEPIKEDKAYDEWSVRRTLATGIFLEEEQMKRLYQAYLSNQDVISIQTRSEVAE